MSRHNAAWAAKLKDRLPGAEIPTTPQLVKPVNSLGDAFSCFIPGDPKGQGGTVPFFDEATGRFKQVTKGMKGLGSWRIAMSNGFAWHARSTGHVLITGPFRLKIMFFMPRLAGAPKTIMGDIWPIGKRDADKLERAANDSLVKGGIVKDDGANVITIRVKRFCGLTDTPGVLVQVKPIGMREPLETACPEAARAFADPIFSQPNQEVPS